jgi:hypothetical protein
MFLIVEFTSFSRNDPKTSDFDEIIDEMFVFSSYFRIVNSD